MKPIRLDIEGIHSFTEKQTVDFERLCQNKLFGIFGSTGSGKSTVLDCIMLSLYGGINRCGDKDVTSFINNKSDFASVEFEFILHEEGKDNRYVLKRTFKKRRSGTATTATLTQILDSGEKISLAEKTERIKSFVEEHLGLSSDQFKKCIALPQGEFSALLKATKNEQTDLIGRLFDLEQYGAPLFERFSSRFSRLDGETAGMISQISQLGDISQKRGKELSDSLSGLSKKIQESEKKGEELTKKFAELSEGLKNIQKVEEIRQNLSKLNLKLPQIEDLKTKLKEAEKASELLPVFSRKEAAEKALTESKNALDRAKTATEQSEKRKEQAALKFSVEGEALSVKIKDLTQKISALSALKNSVDKISALDEFLISARSNYTAQKTELSTVEKQIALLFSEKEKTEKLLTEETEKAAELNTLFQQLAEREFYRGKKEAYGEISQKLQADTEKAKGETVKYIESLTEFVSRLNSAVTLNQPQQEGGLDRIKEEKNTADSQKNKLEQLCKKQEIEILGLQQKQTQFRQSLERITEEGRQKNEERTLLCGELQKYGLQNPKEYQSYIQQINAELFKKEKNREELEKDKADTERQFNTLSAVLQGANATFNERQSAFKETEQEANSLLLLHGYTSFEQVKPFLLSKEQTDSLKKTVQDFERDLSATEEQLKRESLFLPKTEVTKEQAEAVLQEQKAHKERHEGIISEQARLLLEQEQYGKNYVLGQELEKKLAETGGELKFCDVLKGLTKGKALMEYAAEEYFAEISFSASQKLSQLTGGRYALSYKGGFLVSDNLSGGAEREVKTLSGGETFLVSLSLAVALQETIVSLSGKPLDFFFLDEGFGTLDETLAETVMDSLEKLKDTHFTIGLISHLPELRRRIPAQLIVTSATEQSGSTVTLVV